MAFVLRKYLSGPVLLWGIALVLFLGILGFMMQGKPKPPVSTPPTASAAYAKPTSVIPSLFSLRQTKPSLFDGLAIDPEYHESMVSVMIDNFALARAQHSGIRGASIVYEALAEGGITRLMLLFPYQEITRVGPIRSAREYFVDFAKEYGGIYAHAGGAPSALQKLSASPLLDFDEDDPLLSKEPYSIRDPHYVAPHNLFYNLLLIRERAQIRNASIQAPTKSWCFTDEAPAETLPSVEKIALDFSHDKTSSYYVQFVYFPAQNVYKRYYGLKPTPHTDQFDQLQVAPTNVIVQIEPSQLIAGDEKERIRMAETGRGKIFFYSQGKKMKGTWEKKTLSSVTEYFDENGNEICVHPGQTWIAILDGESLVSESQ